MFTRSLTAAAGLMLTATHVLAQGYGSPTLLPLPEDPEPSYRAAAAVRPYAASHYGTSLASNDEPALAPEPVPAPFPESHDSNGYTGEYSSPSPSDNAAQADGGHEMPGCASGNCWDDGGVACGDDNWLGPWCGAGGCNNGWFGSVGGLVMTRDNPNSFWTSYESGVNANQIMNTNDAEADWTGGMFVSFGKWFNSCDPSNTCGPRFGMEAVYFGTGTMNGYSEVFAADPANGEWVSSTIDMNDVGGPIEFPDGNEVDDYFDNSANQWLSRRDYFHNVELNFLSQYWQPNARCNVTWLAGVRWFRFDEGLLYGATAGASAVTSVSDQAFMNFETTNDLVGFQLGARCEWYATQRFSLYVTPKFGLYGNYIQTRNRVYNGDGSSLYDFQQDTTGVSFLGEIDCGCAWAFARNWRATIGYKAVAATGMALADNQIPHYLAAADELQEIRRNGSLVVHGGYAGLEFCF
jgi:hypothetical protein